MLFQAYVIVVIAYCNSVVYFIYIKQVVLILFSHASLTSIVVQAGDKDFIAGRDLKYQTNWAHLLKRNGHIST